MSTRWAFGRRDVAHLLLSSFCFSSLTVIPAQTPTIKNTLPRSFYEAQGLQPGSDRKPYDFAAASTNLTPTSITQTLTKSDTYLIDLTKQNRVSNQRIVLANTGNVDVVNPWVVINGKRNWFNTDSIVAEAVESETDPELRAFRLWMLMRNNRYDSGAAETGMEMHSPVKMLNVYGYGMCDDATNNLCCLWSSAGFHDVRGWDLNGHVVSEVSYGGAWHLFDSDLEYFYPSYDDRTVASVEELAAHRDLIDRVSPPNIGDIYASTGDNNPYDPPTDSAFNMAMRLRPGESLERCFYNWGKFHDNYTHTVPPVFGNGRITYTPPLDKDSIYRAGFDAVVNVADVSNPVASPLIHPIETEDPGLLLCTMNSPYVIVGGSVQMNVQCNSPQDSVIVVVSPDYRNWYTAGTATGPFAGNCTIPLDGIIDTMNKPACYHLYFDFILTGAAANSTGINGITMTAEIQCSPVALPTLDFQTLNRVVVTFDGDPQARLQIEHDWSQTSSGQKTRIARLVRPTNHSNITNATPQLFWSSGVEDSGQLWREVEVSWDPSGFHPVSPVLWTTGTGPTNWTVPDKWLTVGNAYSWRVRQQFSNASWSAPNQFHFAAPTATQDWQLYK